MEKRNEKSIASSLYPRLDKGKHLYPSMQNNDQIRYLPLDEYRYESELRHLVALAKAEGWYEYATKKSRDLATKDPEIFGKLPTDLWRHLKDK